MPIIGKIMVGFLWALIQLGALAAHASSVGPFVLQSEKSSDFQRPPYKTGRRVGCEAAFLTSGSGSVNGSFAGFPGHYSSVLEVRDAVKVAGPAIEKKLVDLILKNNPLASRLAVETRFNLSCGVCRGASFLMVPQLDEMGIRLDLTPVLTPWIAALQTSHIYLTHQNYFGLGQHLIIDPTIRQFFSKQMSREDVETKIPQVFVGSAAELEALFLRHFQPSDEGLQMKAKELVPYYLHPDPIDYLLDPSA